MSSLENTNSRPMEIHALGILAEGADSYIGGMEAAGQRQLVNSDRLPTSSHEGDEPYLALGFTFGDPDPRDQLFRPATLPPGWSRAGTDHNMHSSLLDEHGRKRAEIFYKAAFYDRRADMTLIQPSGYAQDIAWNGGEPVFDDWCTREAFREALAAIRERSVEYIGLYADRSDEYGVARAKELEDEIARIDRLAKQYAARPGSGS